VPRTLQCILVSMPLIATTPVHLEPPSLYMHPNAELTKYKHKGWRMLSRVVLTSLLAAAFLPSQPAVAQVTYGKKPDLPKPFDTRSAGNGPDRAKAPAGFLPTVPAGFHVNVFATGLDNPRFLLTAENGDIFLAETGAGKIIVLHDPQHTGGAQQQEVFASGLKRPFGLAIHGDYLYVGNTGEVVRFKYDKKDSKRLGESEHVLDLPPGGGHFTRTLAFSLDGNTLYVSVGSSGNIDLEKDSRRAAVLACDPDGKNSRIYASGLRNAVGLAVEPHTGAVWVSVNERDELGDNLPPDYFTSIKDSGFYGWPYSYIGDNVDPRIRPQKPDMVAKAIIPDVLLGAHVAPLQFAFYNAMQFPESYRGGAFIAEHGSWNRASRSGYQVAFVGMKDGKAVADPIPFLTGFVADPRGKDVYGRPVGVAVAPDGSLLVTDDGTGTIYRISYTK
jgi:glucose/arabinose dehydrogenase